MFSYLDPSYRCTRNSAVKLFEDRLSLLRTGESEDCETLILCHFFINCVWRGFICLPTKKENSFRAENIFDNYEILFKDYYKNECINVLWNFLSIADLVAVVLCNVQESRQDEDTKRSFLARRAIDGSRGRYGGINE